MLGRENQLIIHNRLPLLAKQGARRVHTNRQASQDTLIRPIRLEQRSILKEPGQKTLQHNLEVMSTSLFGIHTRPFGELDKLFPDIEDVPHMPGVDKVFAAPVSVALDGFIGAEGVEEREVVAVEGGEFLAGFVGFFAF